jgi:hypothetical protein
MKGKGFIGRNRMRLYRRRDSRMVTATELACFEYCKEQWRLQYALGLEPGNRAALDAGARHHAGKAVAERVAGGSIGVGRMLIVVALLLLILWWVWR